MINPVEQYKSWSWRLTSPYGPRTGQYAGFHRGVDFGGKPCGAPVKTPFAGKVVAARTSGMGTWGNTVCIELAPDGKYVSLNAHLEKIMVKYGQVVKAGDVIGTNGGSNHSGPAFACHIHYEIQLNNGTAPWRGEHINPATFYLNQEPQEPSVRFKTDDLIYNRTISNVNVRSNAGTANPIVASIAPGERVIIQEDSKNGEKVGRYYWWRIKEGWIAEDFFDLISVPEPEITVPPELEEPLNEQQEQPGEPENEPDQPEPANNEHPDEPENEADQQPVEPEINDIPPEDIDQPDQPGYSEPEPVPRPATTLHSNPGERGENRPTTAKDLSLIERIRRFFRSL